MGQSAIYDYIEKIAKEFQTGHATEHSYRPALKDLMASFDKVKAVNEPKHSEHGAPDFVFLSDNNNDLILGYAEAKDITISLDRTEKSEQMKRYAGYANLYLTDYLEFRFFKNGEKYETISLGHIKDGKLYKTPENAERLMRELEAFLQQTPESIRSGKRLAQIMGGKARRIRDNVALYLGDDTATSQELVKMYQMMQKMLVHDLSEEKFADMYAQTLVYGLFVARYGDSTPESFTRSEARDLVPASNPFLRHFFDHIVGPNFDTRLGYIVDELCEIFSVSDVREIVHKHLRIADESTDAKDPIIHFYEDFLQEYDPAERKKMGAYYTPTPVVKYIVRQVDRILREDFGIAKGLASTETITQTIDTQPWRKKGERKDRTTRDITLPRVQVLDPAVGTATFLNETIKFVHKEFAGQEGMWPSYVNDNLLKRLHGFELMMAPYTIAHLKLGMTLRETGVDSLSERLGVYLTNTLEEGVPQQPDLFSFGLAEAVSEESRLAAEIKSEKPVMVVMGNPPYSVSSNNKSKYIQELIKDYKKDLNERKINLDDDYIKFIRFAEDMIAKNGSGVVAMITNNSYIDGITHRQMRKHLLQTFDKIYVLDLHGSTTKGETSPDGTVDENVFDIKTGVSIVLMVKTKSEPRTLAEVYHADLYGKRAVKFDLLNENEPHFIKLSITEPYYFMTPKDSSALVDFNSGVSLGELFVTKSSPFRSGQDDVQITWERKQIENVVNDLVDLPEQEYRSKYNLKDGRNHNYAGMKADVAEGLDEQRIARIMYRPFDIRWTYYSKKSSSFAARPRNSTMNNFVFKRNIGLLFTRINRQLSTGYFFIFDGIPDSQVIDKLADEHVLDNGLDSVLAAPLYLYHEDGTRTPNFAPAELSALTRQLTSELSPEDVLDYIYAVLHSPSYRAKYKEFLKIDFPRVPAPTQSEFDRLVPLGRQLRQLHLMKSPVVDDFITTYPVAGDNVVEKPRFVPDTISSVDATSGGSDAISSVSGRVYINETQYFGSVPQLAWNFYIGGYQPAQKWLKDRRGRTLTMQDIAHYQRIIRILCETDKIMADIG